MRLLTHYIDTIVVPTFEDFKRNPASERHAFLACVVTYHAIDRYAEEIGRSVGNLRREWGKKIEFKAIDLVAHHLKHVQSSDERLPPTKDKLPISFLVFRPSAVGTHAVNAAPVGGEVKMQTRDLYFAVRDVIKFLREKADELRARGVKPAAT
jgi:hypothetical protein